MGTIKPFDADNMRVQASERIHKMFRGAAVIYVKYKNTFADGYCQYSDGTKAFFTVWYRDLLNGSKPIDVEYDGQHDRAIEYVNSLPERPWAS